MIRINLLPHRELKRKAQAQQMAIMAGLATVLGLGLVWGVHIVFTDKIALSL